MQSMHTPKELPGILHRSKLFYFQAADGPFLVLRLGRKKRIVSGLPSADTWQENNWKELSMTKLKYQKPVARDLGDLTHASGASGPNVCVGGVGVATSCTPNGSQFIFAGCSTGGGFGDPDCTAGPAATTCNAGVAAT